LRSLKIGRASCRNENDGTSAATSETAVPITPGTVGGVACAGAVTGEKVAGPTLAGRPKKCLSDGSDISGGAAGAVAGTELNAGRSVGIGWAGSGLDGTSSELGSAVKNSFAMRASVTGSSTPAGSVPEGRGVVAARGSVSGATKSRAGSLVLMVVSDFDVLQRCNRIVRQNRSRTIERNQIRGKSAIVDSCKVHGKTRALLSC